MSEREGKGGMTAKDYADHTNCLLVSGSQLVDTSAYL